MSCERIFTKKKYRKNHQMDNILMCRTVAVAGTYHLKLDKLIVEKEWGWVTQFPDENAIFIASQRHKV